MAEKGNTKQEILEAALDLFSAQGFEATSMQLMTWSTAWISGWLTLRPKYSAGRDAFTKLQPRFWAGKNSSRNIPEVRIFSHGFLMYHSEATENTFTDIDRMIASAGWWNKHGLGIFHTVGMLRDFAAQNSVFYVCAHAHGLSLWLRDSSTCGAVPERSEGMSREDGEVRIARPAARQESSWKKIYLRFFSVNSFIAKCESIIIPAVIPKYSDTHTKMFGAESFHAFCQKR